MIISNQYDLISKNTIYEFWNAYKIETNGSSLIQNSNYSSSSSRMIPSLDAIRLTEEMTCSWTKLKLIAKSEMPKRRYKLHNAMLTCEMFKLVELVNENIKLYISGFLKKCYLHANFDFLSWNEISEADCC